MKTDPRLWRLPPMAITWCAFLLFLPLLLVGSLTSAAQSRANAITTTAWFGHLAIGEGYSTIFALFNTGSDTLAGNLILTGKDGLPLRANLVSSDGTTVGTLAMEQGRPWRIPGRMSTQRSADTTSPIA